MTLRERDKKALIVLALAVVVWLALQFALPGDSGPKTATGTNAIFTAEKRLARLQQLAASVPGKEEILKRAGAELAEREKGILRSDTAAQAQAQLLEILRRTAKTQMPPVDLRNFELGQPRPLSEDYGEVQASASFECGIEVLLNLLADITAQPEQVAVHELRVTSGNQKTKTVGVRLTISGVVPRRLVPEKKGFTSF